MENTNAMENKNERKPRVKRRDFSVTWFDGKEVDEVAFAEAFLLKHPLRVVDGLLYDVDGPVDPEELKRLIFSDLEKYLKKRLHQTVKSLIEVIKMKAANGDLPLDIDRVHFANGTYYLDWGEFSTEKCFCANRLPVNYDPDAPKPERWLAFLNELLYPEDIPTLQEYMGYLFIPTTRAQVMLMLLGKGGEGKSRIGVVLKGIMGDNMNVCPLDKLASNRFARADQQGKLVMLDDDMKLEGIKDTSVLKSVVTMETKMDLERKGVQSTQGFLYVRLLGFGNGALQALHDQSDGFFRRQIYLTVKERPKDRVDDRNLSEKLLEELPGIVNWCLEGLKRLIQRKFHFELSERARKNLELIKQDSNNIFSFLESTGYFCSDPDSYVLTRDLIRAYKDWCENNGETPRADGTFCRMMREALQQLDAEYDENLPDGRGGRARGYRGIRLLDRYRRCA